MRYWFKGLPVAPFVQSNLPKVALYWFQGLPIGRISGAPIPPPPPGNPALPTGLAAARREEDDQPPMLQRRFAPVITVAAAFPFERFLMPEVEDPWFPFLMNRRVYTPVAVPVNIRPYTQIFVC